MKIILGTASFNKDYGIFKKKNEKIDVRKLNRLHRFCKTYKIAYIDTSPYYKGVEEIIGKSQLRNMKIINKIKINKNFNEKNFNQKIIHSLNKLRCKKFYGILIHNPKNLNKGNIKIVINSLKKLKNKNIVKKIGISIYDKNDINKFWGSWKPDIVQLPLNIFNRSLSENNWIKNFREHKIELHVRSIFLQGLLVSNLIPNKFKKFSKIFQEWKKITNNKTKTKILHSLCYVKDYVGVKNLVIGFQNLRQLNVIMLLINKKLNNFNYLKKINIKSSILKDPRNWKYL